MERSFYQLVPQRRVHIKISPGFIKNRQSRGFFAKTCVYFMLWAGALLLLCRVWPEPARILMPHRPQGDDHA